MVSVFCMSTMYLRQDIKVAHYIRIQYGFILVHNKMKTVVHMSVFSGAKKIIFWFSLTTQIYFPVQTFCEYTSNLFLVHSWILGSPQNHQILSLTM